MKHALFILLIVTVAACVVYADANTSPAQARLAQASLVQVNLVQTSMAGSGDFSASAVLWFSGTNVTAQISGAISLTGDLTIGDTKTAFHAQGTLSGAASGDSNTLIGSGWATFTARGMLDSGEVITLHGAIELSTNDVDLSADTAGSGTGSLYVVLTLPDQTLRLRGIVSGNAGGGFVAPDDPQTMQLDGIGSFTFSVATRDAAEGGSNLDGSAESGLSPEGGLSPESGLSWNTDEWSQELREQFTRMIEEESE